MYDYKKVIGLFFSFVLSLSTFSPCSEKANCADEIESNKVIQNNAESIISDEGFYNCYSVLVNYPEVFDIELNSENAYIGNPFCVYNVNENSNLTYNDKAIYYPVLDDTGVKAFVIGQKNDEKYSYTCGEYFAEALNNYLLENDSVALLVDENSNVYALNEDDALLPISIAYENTDIISFVDNAESASYMDTSYIYKNAEKRLAIDDTKLVASVNDFKTGYVILSKFPQIQQYNNTCWAVTITAIARYIGYTTSVEAVVSRYISLTSDYDYDAVTEGVSFEDTLLTMRSIMYNDQLVPWHNRLTKSMILLSINNNMSSLIAGTSSNSMGHMVSLIGYYSFSSGDFQGCFYMNSQNASVSYFDYGDNECYFDSAGGNVSYKWEKSIIINS